MALNEPSNWALQIKHEQLELQQQCASWMSKSSECSDNQRQIIFSTTNFNIGSHNYYDSIENFPVKFLFQLATRKNHYGADRIIECREWVFWPFQKLEWATEDGKVKNPIDANWSKLTTSMSNRIPNKIRINRKSI